MRFTTYANLLEGSTATFVGELPTATGVFAVRKL
jgi:hypothetical protein